MPRMASARIRLVFFGMMCILPPFHWRGSEPCKKAFRIITWKVSDAGNKQSRRVSAVTVSRPGAFPRLLRQHNCSRSRRVGRFSRGTTKGASARCCCCISWHVCNSAGYITVSPASRVSKCCTMSVVAGPTHLRLLRLLAVLLGSKGLRDFQRVGNASSVCRWANDSKKAASSARTAVATLEHRHRCWSRCQARANCPYRNQWDVSEGSRGWSSPLHQASKIARSVVIRSVARIWRERFQWKALTWMSCHVSGLKCFLRGNRCRCGCRPRNHRCKTAAWEWTSNVHGTCGGGSTAGPTCAGDGRGAGRRERYQRVKGTSTATAKWSGRWVAKSMSVTNDCTEGCLKASSTRTKSMRPSEPFACAKVEAGPLWWHSNVWGANMP